MHITHETVKGKIRCIQGDVIESLASYMRKNDKTIRVAETYDSQAGWKGAYMFIEDKNGKQVDLSGNGFCLCTHGPSIIREFLEHNQ